MSADVRTGRCLCGAVTYEAVLNKDAINVCHCGRCRQLTAGPFFAVDAKSLAFAEGAPVTVYDSSDWATRSFCAKCGTAIAWHSKDGDMIELSAYTLDEPPAEAIAVEIFIDDKPANYAFANTTHKLTGAEVMALAAGG